MKYASLRYHIDRKTGALSRIIERGVKGVEFLLRFMLFSIGPLILELMFVGGILFYLFDVWYLAVVVVTIGLYIWFTFKVTEWRVRIRKQMNDLDADANQKAIDSLLNFETVKYFNAEEREATRYDESMRGYEAAALKTNYTLGFLNFGQSFFITIGLILVMVMAAIGERPVAGILVTHTHTDHSPGAAPLKLLTGAKTYGFGTLSAELLALTDEEVDIDFVPDVALSDGQTVGDGAWQVTALHTPGHFPNHMCYQLESKGMIFSGDHVMGWSTTAIIPPLGNLKEYLEGLDKLAGYSTLAMLPSHGPVIESPAKRISDVRDHRLARHKQVEACVRRGVRAPSAIVEEIYTDLTPRLIEAAKGCVKAHLEYITESAEKRLVVGLVQSVATA
ncbi:MAG: MBL fold metallo-hydrolase [Kordiimonadaceae bacterium]|nr:MBL fold metallo-hydrolase [Kordiimonadaceae bacterium]